jgi:hypothetical protein
MRAFLSLGAVKLAERVGFEPTLEFPLNTLSKRAPSATRPSLRAFALKEFYGDAAVGATGTEPSAISRQLSGSINANTDTLRHA